MSLACGERKLAGVCLTNACDDRKLADVCLTNACDNRKLESVCLTNAYDNRKPAGVCLMPFYNDCFYLSGTLPVSLLTNSLFISLYFSITCLRLIMICQR